MPERVYNGPHPEVDVVLPGRVVKVVRGEKFDVSADEAKGLDQQGDTYLTPAAAAKDPINPAGDGKKAS